MKIGIAGAGTIVPDFLKAQEKIAEMEVVSICGTPRHKDRLEQFAKEHAIEKVYTDVDEMINDPSLDVIYVALPNHLHYSCSKKALEHGKSVICEKPFCSNEQQAQELVDLAKKKELFLFEAISNQYFPNYEKVKELLPELGSIKICELNYSQYSRRYDDFKKGNILPAFDPKKSGGALMDLNVYNIHFLTGLFGKPEWIQYTANIERDIDTSGVLVMKYKDFTCVSIGAKDCVAPVGINIQGDRGYIHSDTPANVFSNFILKRNESEKEHYALNEQEERLYYELRSFVDMVMKNDQVKNQENLAHSLLVQQILDEARQQAGLYIPE